MTPDEIASQRAAGWPDFHPETYCHRCGNLNVPSWWVDSDRWNIATANDPRTSTVILCPSCFVAAHEAATGLHSTWRLVPEMFRHLDWQDVRNEGDPT